VGCIWVGWLRPLGHLFGQLARLGSPGVNKIERQLVAAFQYSHIRRWGSTTTCWLCVDTFGASILCGANPEPYGSLNWRYLCCPISPTSVSHVGAVETRPEPLPFGVAIAKPGGRPAKCLRQAQLHSVRSKWLLQSLPNCSDCLPGPAAR